MPEIANRSRSLGWASRDSIAAAALFCATAATVLRQNARVAVLWDISYLLETSYRFALGQMPYRDLPLVHAPLTFLLQAAIIRLTGRVFFHHVLYAAIVSGLGTVLTWRIAVHALFGKVHGAWVTALLLAAPLTVLGIYGIFPTPFYDCDCVFFILIAVRLLQRVEMRPARGWGFAAGCATVLPVFFKQNIGLPFLLVVVGGVGVLLAIRLLSRDTGRGTSTLWMVLAGASATMLGAVLLLHWTTGLRNYYYWTVTFAGERRLPGLGEMLGVYREPSLLWVLPCVAAAALLLRSRFSSWRWVHPLAFGLLAAPFVPPLVGLLLSSDPEDRAGGLLALWPPVLMVAAVLTLYRLRGVLRQPDLGLLLTFALLAAIHGALLSQQLWGSTYAIWPLFILLVVQMLASLLPSDSPRAEQATASRFDNLIPVLAAVIAITLLLCGGLYTFSEDRLSYAQLGDGELVHATAPALAGMSTRGPYLPDFEQLLAFAAREIPRDDGLLLLPGEDPFYFATGRTPRFPVSFFDRTCDPYSPEELVQQARTHNIRWLVVKQRLQLTSQVLPEAEQTITLLVKNFVLYRRLDGYDVYRRP